MKALELTTHSTGILIYINPLSMICWYPLDEERTRIELQGAYEGNDSHVDVVERPSSIAASFTAAVQR